MRHYPRNSPQTAGRILALALLSDGHLCKREMDVLDRLDAPTRLGLSRNELQTVVHGFCEDLLSQMQRCWGDACRIDQVTLAALLADIDDPALRNMLLQLCRAIVAADDHVADGESQLLLAAVDHWGRQHDLLAGPRGSTQLRS